VIPEMRLSPSALADRDTAKGGTREDRPSEDRRQLRHDSREPSANCAAAPEEPSAFLPAFVRFGPVADFS